jgi:hypothetical protein
VRVACLISESIRNALDLLEEQPPDVIEAMLEGSEEAERAGGLPKQRAALRAEIRKYMADYCLKEDAPESADCSSTVNRAHMAYDGGGINITGLEEPDHA